MIINHNSSIVHVINLIKGSAVGIFNDHTDEHYFCAKAFGTEISAVVPMGKTIRVVVRKYGLIPFEISGITIEGREVTFVAVNAVDSIVY